MEVVRTYSDAARSGLNLEGRDGLRELLRDVESGRADYTDILVYDVSRWGRFQDADESAYYEYICKRANSNIAQIYKTWKKPDVSRLYEQKAVALSAAAAERLSKYKHPQNPEDKIAALTNAIMNAEIKIEG